MALEKWKAELDAEVKLTIASKPEASVSALKEQIAGLVEGASATPEILRDAAGRAVGVKRGAKVYGIKRGLDDEVMGLEEMPAAAETV
jgi:hypothetical protein